MQQLLNKTHGDKVIWGVIIMLSLFSLLVVYSSTGSLAYRHKDGHAEVYLLKHFLAMALGFVIIFFSHRLNYTVYNRIAVIIFAVSIPLLIYTMFFGATLNEGSRWIRVPVINLTFQTSDLAKLGLFMFLARQLSKYQDKIHDLRTVAQQIFAPVGIIVLLIAPSNLSTALMLGITCSLLFFIGRVQFKHLLLLAACGVIGLLSVYGISKVTGKGRAATWEQRIKDFGHKDASAEEPFQVLQAKIAIAKGGVFGVGPGNSTQRNFLPHPYSDFVYASILEEYGILGGAVLVFLYLLLLWRSILIFKKCPYAFGAFLAIGLSFTLVFQAMLNMAVNVNLVPVTGLTLPFVSMGGSSMWFTSLTVGIILSVSKYVDEMEGSKKEIA
jgi:cell division protein FtsW